MALHAEALGHWTLRGEWSRIGPGAQESGLLIRLCAVHREALKPQAMSVLPTVSFVASGAGCSQELHP